MPSWAVEFGLGLRNTRDLTTSEDQWEGTMRELSVGGSRRDFMLGTTAAISSLLLKESTFAAFDSLPDPSELVSKSASELARMIRKGEISSAEVVEAHLDRIEELKPINAIAQVSDTALQEARRIDQKRKVLGPLHGVPVSIKDQFDVNGLITACGLTAKADNQASKDATAVAKLRSAGAIILCKTNVPPGCGHVETDNPLYGQTNNPFDLKRTPGGSSGGEGALIAACGSPLGLGGDEGGSIRIPAHFCGIAGLRPSWGRVSLAGSDPFPTGGNAAFWTAGPMARYVEDLELMLNVIKGVDPLDPYTFPVDLRESDDVRLNKLRFATWTGIGLPETPPPTPNTLSTLDRAKEILLGVGAEFEPKGPPGIDGLPDLHDAVWDPEEIITDPQLPISKFELDAQATRHFLKRRGRISKAQKQVARTQLLPGFQSSWLSYLDDVDVILSPVCSSPAFLHHTTWNEIYAFNYTFAVSMLPGVPAGTVRCGTSPEGLPIGVQVIGKPYREDIVLAAMKCLEQSEHGGWRI